VRAASLLFGLFLFAVGLAAFIESELGVPPWDVFHQGVARRTPLTFGLAIILVGLVVLAVAWLAGQRPGIGTLANSLFVGAYLEGLTRIGWIAELSERGVAPRAALLLVGVSLTALGTAFYIGAAFGAGPRDGLMLVLSARTGRRIAIVRAVLEVAVLIAGIALGGTAGLGTLLFAVLIGPAVEASFALLLRSPLVEGPSG